MESYIMLLSRVSKRIPDDFYFIRVDSVNRTAVLDEVGNVRGKAAEAIVKENGTQIAKIL